MRLAAAGLLALGLALAVGAPPAFAQAGGGAPVIDAPTARGIAESGGLLVDIRSPADRRAAGGPAGAVTIPLQDDERRLRAEFAAEVLAAAGGHPDRPVALIDENGRRSGHAAQMLAARGFTQAFAVGEGLFGGNLGPGWVARGLPMEPCQGC